jgi:BirA family transcriptional regulator, biotin operon repressor / biotin---[acetyl-CoA-carboxylase] ligase
MSMQKIPGVLIDLAHVGDSGLPLNPDPWFQQELEQCEKWGFRINRAGARVFLRFDHDQLVPYWIQRETPALAWDWLRVNGFLRIGSTNDEALELARQGAPSGTLVYAEEQTAGKGRKGRSWFAAAGKGLYFSIVLKPQQPHKNWPVLTHVAALALVEALRDLSINAVIPHPLDIDIKWPNDVLISGKKCAGILLETISANNETYAAVVGVGINVHDGSVPEALVSEATCIDVMAGAPVPRRELLIRFLRHFQKLFLIFEAGNHEELLELYKRFSSMWDGAQVLIEDGDVRRAGTTCGLNEIGALLIRTEQGSVETILAGDVRVRRAANS